MTFAECWNRQMYELSLLNPIDRIFQIESLIFKYRYILTSRDHSFEDKIYVRAKIRATKHCEKYGVKYV